MNYDPKLTLEYPDADAESNAVAILISFIGLMVALLGAEGLFRQVWIGTGVCWAFVVLGLCTFLLGLALRYSTQH